MQLIQISLIVSILTTVGVNAQTDSISFGIQKENLLTTEEIMNLPEIEKEDDGVWRSYYKSGELQMETNYKRVFLWKKLKFINVKQGPTITYRKTGEIYRVEEYKRGKLKRVD